MKKVYYLLFLSLCACNRFDEAGFYEKAALVIQKGVNKQDLISKKALLGMRIAIVEGGEKARDVEFYRKAEGFYNNYELLSREKGRMAFLDSIYISQKNGYNKLNDIREDIQLIEKGKTPDGFKALLIESVLIALKKEKMRDYASQVGYNTSCNWFDRVIPIAYLQADTIIQDDSVTGKVFLQSSGMTPYIITKVVMNGQELASIKKEPNALNPKRFVFPALENVNFDANGEYIHNWSGAVYYIDSETYEERNLPISGHYKIEKK